MYYDVLEFNKVVEKLVETTGYCGMWNLISMPLPYANSKAQIQALQYPFYAIFKLVNDLKYLMNAIFLLFKNLLCQSRKWDDILTVIFGCIINTIIDFASLVFTIISLISRTISTLIHSYPDSKHQYDFQLPDDFQHPGDIEHLRFFPEQLENNLQKCAKSVWNPTSSHELDIDNFISY